MSPSVWSGGAIVYHNSSIERRPPVCTLIRHPGLTWWGSAYSTPGCARFIGSADLLPRFPPSRHRLGAGQCSAVTNEHVQTWLRSCSSKSGVTNDLAAFTWAAQASYVLSPVPCVGLGPRRLRDAPGSGPVT
jgi:hypothetical protein